MTDPTPEQVQEARRHIGALGRTSIIPDEARVPPYEDAHEQDWALENEALILLATLEAAEKERDTEIAKWKVRTHEVEAILSRIIDHYEYDAEECARFRGKACERCQDIIDAKNLLRLQHVDTTTLRDLSSVITQ